MNNKPMLAAAFALGSAVVLPFVDSMVKVLLVTYPIAMVACARFGISTLFLAIIVVRRQGPAALIPNAWRLQTLRALSAVFGTLFVFEGFRTMPLAECQAIVFIAPVIANLLAWWWLKEKADVVSWITALVSFVGVLLIIKPGTALFTPEALFPLTGAFGLASFLVLSRAVSDKDDPGTTAFVGAGIGTLAFLCMLPWNWVSLSVGLDLLFFLLVGIGATAANLLIAWSYRYGKTYFVTPISYSSLIIVTILAYLFFGELPGAWAALGMAIILISGTVLVLHSARASQRISASRGQIVLR